MLRQPRKLLVQPCAKALHTYHGLGYTLQRGLLQGTSSYPAWTDNAYYATKTTKQVSRKGSSPSNMSRDAWINRFGTCTSLPDTAVRRGTHCPKFVSSFRLDTQTAMAFASDYLPRVSQANHFVAPYSEAALCLTIYEMLKTFGKVSSGMLLEAATVEQALDIKMEGPPKGVSLHVEQPLKEMGWGENVEFVIKDQATDKIALVVEVKQTLADKPAALWHILSELAIAARHNQGVAFGTLTNVNCWVFFRVEALQGENGFCVRMSDALWLGTTPIGLGMRMSSSYSSYSSCVRLYSQRKVPFHRRRWNKHWQPWTLTQSS